MSKRKIQQKLFMLLAAMGIIPVIIIIAFISLQLSNEIENAWAERSLLKDTIISEQLSAVCEKKFYALHTLAVAPAIRDYLQEPTEAKKAAALQLLNDATHFARNNSLLVLTAADGQQLIRTDNMPLVNVAQREHFQAAMQKQDYISNIILSMSTGELIAVLEVPVLDSRQQPIGMVQCNYDLLTIQNFVQKHDDEFSALLVFDKSNQIVSHSEFNLTSIEERQAAQVYNTLPDSLTGSTGTIRIPVLGQDSLVSSIRDETTGWLIVTISPYSILQQQITKLIINMAIVGLLVMLLVFAAAYLLSKKATLPLLKIIQSVKQLTNRQENLSNLPPATNDELDEITIALTDIHNAQKNFRQAAERDPITKLYNNHALEAISRIKLQHYLEDDSNTCMAFFLLSLDNYQQICQASQHKYDTDILTHFSRSLRDIFRSGDIIGHLDEACFMIIIDQLKETDIVLRKGALITQAARQLTIDGKNLQLTASVGISLVPLHGKTFKILSHVAKQAMAEAHDAGGNTCRLAPI